MRCRPRCPRREVRAPHNTRQAVLLSHGRFAQAAAHQRGLRLLFSWIYDVPSLLAIILFGAGFVAVFWLGLLLLRPFVRRLLPQERGLNATLTMYLQYFGIIYGLLLGLLAVGAYQNHAKTRRSVVAEAAALAALYRDISGYAISRRSQGAGA